ncbi:MAG TPA: hypothetical protein DDX39_08855 [Bacteroidales bacterium]|nr:MAG: hypothetical protein A2W98_11975 [Bacteroidetes bacterium GWF2_33_38]OFY74699.1 MAG: hypothetical protein A2265_01535 [Bacteroidetes bacterium RIFOXYA12_FULL_33_9]HBF88736.1 hypothetical protein [Bacteroidales bacterium]
MKSSFFLQLLFVTIVSLTISCNNDEKATEISEFVFCDAENLSADSSMIVPSTKFWTSTFKGGKMISDEQAKNGKSSIKLFDKNQFGLTYIVNNVKSGDKFVAEVWRFGADLALVASARDSKLFYKDQKEAKEKDERGWEKLELEITIPAGYIETELLIYVWNPKKDIANFADDLKISFIQKTSE